MMRLGEYYATGKENWRVVLLSALLILSALALFAPNSNADGPTNLQYGLELEGGTSVRAPFVGMTAEQVELGDRDPVEIERAVAEELGVDRSDVKVRRASGTAELFRDDVSREAFAAALRSTGLDVQASDVRDGVSAETRDIAVNVVERKISESPDVTGGRVSLISQPTGERFISIEIPNANRSQVLSLVQERGLVEVVAVFPAEGNGTNGTAGANGTAPANGTQDSDSYQAPAGYRAHTLFTQDELERVGSAQDPPGDRPPRVDVVLTDRAGQNFSEAMQKWGFTSEGVDSCLYPSEGSDPGYCLLTVVDGEVVYSASMGGSLADIINNGEFTKTNDFIMEANNISAARELRVNLQAGALPTDLDLQSGTTYFVESEVAQEFKVFSLVTGVLAAIAVALAVYLRYRDVRVAAPMTLTALAEVFILLGFAAAIQLPMDLAHIAGFIAVIGTGVDDLVIIADEVLSQGDVKTRRVFKSRFRKAFWVIGAAAITTIIAMSPLTVLSLGDLSGFAIITIVGVLIGVLVTRPAYGDVLRSLLTRD